MFFAKSSILTQQSDCEHCLLSFECLMMASSALLLNTYDNHVIPGTKVGIDCRHTRISKLFPLCYIIIYISIIYIILFFFSPFIL